MNSIKNLLPETFIDQHYHIIFSAFYYNSSMNVEYEQTTNSDIFCHSKQLPDTHKEGYI